MNCWKKIHLKAKNDPKDPQKSIGELFKSMSEAYGKTAIGIILTGMGRDGAQELLAMRQRGAITIAQDEKSCLVFGIPREAIKIGAAQYVLSLEDIVATLLKINLTNCEIQG